MSLNIEQLFNESSYQDVSCEIQQADLLISSAELKQKIGSTAVEIISVLNNTSANIPFEVHCKMPYSFFNINDFQPNVKKTYVVVWQKGFSSYDIVLKIKEKYPHLTVLSLENGIEKY